MREIFHIPAGKHKSPVEMDVIHNTLCQYKVRQPSCQNYTTGEGD